MPALPPDHIEYVGDDEARFFGKVTVPVQQFFLSFVRRHRRRGARRLTLDFSQCNGAYPNTMLPIIADVQSLIASGIKVSCILPNNETARNLFHNSNWAHFLCPNEFELNSAAQHYLPVCRFRDSGEQQQVVTQCIESLLRAAELESGVVTAIEWAFNEITDNVLNHSDSAIGGFAQMISYRDRQRVALCVTDGGRGILESLRESHVKLRTDSDAIGEAVRAGVTRNKDIGQGNGLSGSLQLAMASEGYFSILSGKSCLTWTHGTLDSRLMKANGEFKGTSVDVQFSTNRQIDVAALFAQAFETPFPAPGNLIENKYLSDDCKRLVVLVRNETLGFGSRHAGQQFRIKCKNLLSSEPAATLLLDWDGIQVIASSYADELIGKLFVELGPLTFMSRVHLVNMTNVVRVLIDKAILQRSQQFVNGKTTEGI